MQLNEALANDSALRVGITWYQMHHMNSCNKLRCSALGMEHCHSCQLSSKEANQIAMDSDLDRFLWWQLGENENASYPTLGIRSCCMYFSDASKIATCPLGIGMSCTLHGNASNLRPRCTIWRWYQAARLWTISAYLSQFCSPEDQPYMSIN